MAVNNRRNVAAGIVGNILEWYDFAVYGFLAPIIGPLFFPSDDHLASLLSAFAVFAIGYLARPLGGALFGHIGDRYGRKKSMIASILLMGTATLAIALLPTFAQIGTLAAVLLVLLRVLQGISVGGEFTGSMVFLGEHARNESRAAMVAISQCGSLSGFLTGSGIGALVSFYLGDGAMTQWGWRVPFFIGAGIAVLGLVVRRHLTELTVQFHRVELPILVVFRDYWRVLARIVALLMMGAVGFYLLFVYVASYLREQMHFSTAKALEINTISLFVVLALTLPFAMLSDRIGRKPMLYAVAIATLIFGWPLWQLLHQDSFFLILSGQIGLAVISAMTFSVLPTAIVEMIPSHVRCSGTSIGYNLCLGVMGGTTPLVATYLVARTGNDSTPAYYMMALAFIMLAALYKMPETAGKPLA
ncbi:MAG: MHS family MFS transporter [Hyphomicrobiales bacterium]|nr:MHS family MFS transporter [Hyphomicrobiales bacterium]MCP5001980.1 MHS family MFS transporter [Hyphomicrobiales bacterium]